jgi:sugar phosphate isomerase/epimerase
MKLSLSVRVAEKFSDKRQASIDLEGLEVLARDNGYAALCLRASQVGVHSPLAKVQASADILGDGTVLGDRTMAVSMLTGDFAIPENSDDEGPLALRHIGPHLDLAQAVGTDLLRVCMKTEADITWARRAADQAAERGLRLAHQCHTRSLFERVESCLQVVQQVGRPNFGLIYEPANLELCGEAYGGDAIRRLAPHIFNVYVQNQRLDPAGEEVLDTWCRGPVRFDHVALWDRGGIDFPPLLDALGAVGYEGYVTVHQAFGGLNGPREAAEKSARYLLSLGHFDDLSCDG